MSFLFRGSTTTPSGVYERAGLIPGVRVTHLRLTFDHPAFLKLSDKNGQKLIETCGLEWANRQCSLTAALNAVHRTSPNREDCMQFEAFLETMERAGADTIHW